MPGSPVRSFFIRSFAASPLFFDIGFPSGRSLSPKTDGVFPSSRPSFGARLLKILGERGSRFPDCLKPFFLLHRAAGSSGFLSHPGSPPCAFLEIIMSCRKPSKNGKLSLLDTAENKRQDSAGRGKISEAGFSTSDAARSTSSLPSQPQWEAPKHGLPRIAQLDKAKKEGAKYQEQKEQVLPGEERKLQTHADSLSGSRRLCGRRKLRSSELPGPDRQRHDLRDLSLRSLPLNPPEQI